MHLVLDLPRDVSIALRRFANLHQVELEASAVLALREYLTSTGDLELVAALEEDGGVAGNA
ncbi:MAG: hypothetical protein BGO03_11940 [Mesorhizobium sp. 61-13]|nr:MAG: hypothetical protein BGO03_11940 [Mesorhizobium sp. 61-13]